MRRAEHLNLSPAVRGWCLTSLWSMEGAGGLGAGRPGFLPLTGLRLSSWTGDRKAPVAAVILSNTGQWKKEQHLANETLNPLVVQFFPLWSNTFLSGTRAKVTCWASSLDPPGISWEWGRKVAWPPWPAVFSPLLPRATLLRPTLPNNSILSLLSRLGCELHLIK